MTLIEEHLVGFKLQEIQWHSFQDQCMGAPEATTKNALGITPEYPTHPTVLGLGLGLKLGLGIRIRVRD